MDAPGVSDGSGGNLLKGFVKVLREGGLYASRLEHLRSIRYIFGHVLARNRPRREQRLREIRFKNSRGSIRFRPGTTDILVAHEIFASGEYDPLLQKKPQGIRTIIDLGANIGCSVRLWQMHFPDSRIVAVEPSLENSATLQKNLLPPPAPPVEVVNQCVAGTARRVRLDRSLGEWGFRIAAEGAGEPEIPAIPLEKLFDDAGMDSVDLLKMDIEGAEEEVFRDCSRWIQRVNWLIVEVHGAYSADRFLDDLRRGGGDFELFFRRTEVDFSHLFLKNRRC